MIPIRLGFADPQFADHAAVGQRLVHVKFSSCRVHSERPPANRPATDIYDAMQQEFGTKSSGNPLLQKCMPYQRLIAFLCAKNGSDCVLIYSGGHSSLGVATSPPVSFPNHPHACPKLSAPAMRL